MQHLRFSRFGAALHRLALKPVTFAAAALAVSMFFGAAAEAGAQSFSSGFATQVLSASPGSNSGNQPATNVLGNTPETHFGLGYGGSIVVAFDEFVCNSGDANVDFCVFEKWDNEDYYICLNPADAATEAALIASGVPQFGDFFEYSITFTGNFCFDIDSILCPGYGPGELRFEAIMILATNGDTPEITHFSSDYLCTPPPPTVFPTCADTVISFTPGSTGHSDNANNTVGAPDGNWSRLGSGGCVVLGVAGSTITTSGNATPDLAVYEIEPGLGIDAYWLDVKPADAATQTILVNSGLPALAGGFFELGNYTGAEEIDIDVVLPGFASGDLQFECVRICDTPGGASGSAEIDAVCFLLTGSAVASLGDFVFEDLDRDGVQDADEPGIPGVTVSLQDENGNDLGITTTTGPNGEYGFDVAPGTYIVCFGGVVGFEVTTANAGGDEAADSDADQVTGKTDPITIAAGEVNLDIDAGLRCIQAVVNTNLPACGLANDPTLDSTPAVPGSSMMVTMDSNFPFAPTFGFLSLGTPTPFVYPGSPCNIYLDVVTPGNFLLIWEGLTDANGDFQAFFPIPNNPAFAGFQFVMQARVCEPSVPGPIPGTPDWISNGVAMTIGCP